MNELPSFLTAEEASGLLHCSTKTIEERLRTGDLPGEKFGDGWIIPTEALVKRVNEIAVEGMHERRCDKASQRAKFVRFQKQQQQRREPPSLQ